MIESVSRVAAKIAATIRHATDLTSHLGSLGGAVWAIIGAIDANAVQLWGGVAVALMAALWSHVREQKRRDFDDGERRKMLQAMVDANIAAAGKGQSPPFPEVVEFLVRGEKKEPASA